MTNHADSEDILIDQETIEKVTEFKYLGQTTHPKTLQKQKSMPGSEQHGAVLEITTTKKYSKTDNSPFHPKTNNGTMCLASNNLRLPNIVSQ